MYHTVIIYLSVNGHLGGFQFVVIMNRTTMNVYEQVRKMQSPPGYMPERGIGGFCGR